MQEKDALIGLYDEKGELIGSKARKDIDKTKDIIKCVNVILFDESNRIFMAKFTNELWANKWGGSCFGLVRREEKTKDAALRTAERELGFSGKLDFINEKYYDFKETRVIMSVFVGRGKNVFPNSQDIYEFEWFGLMDAEDMIKKGECSPTFSAAVKMLGL